MGIFKRIAENRKDSPKTTSKGAGYALVAAIVGFVATLLGAKHPALAEIIQGNLEFIVSGIIAIAGAIYSWFAAKKDK